ncbi:DNA polymerase III subunit epsilon [Buchnera aphidicola]|uniref:DNA polymerase III subunit epsilon n=1 Tax=Buchnera aphidicola TaxID=9 RepID=UPI00313EE525
MNFCSINRKIFLDTETTGMNKTGNLCINHKIIEIGAIEMINRKLTGKKIHFYLKPGRLIDPEAYKIHGISNQFLSKKPFFYEVSQKILNFLKNSTIIVHNAIFDISFLNYEFSLISSQIPKLNKICKIVDTLILARKLFPGKKNTLDALCQRYHINSKNRILHGALLDAQLLSKVYLSMTSKQESIFFSPQKNTSYNITYDYNLENKIISHIIYATQKETNDHVKYLKNICNISKKKIW